MARKLGNDYHLWIDGGSGTYSRVKGQTTLNVTRNGQAIDISAKEDFPYAAQAPGMRTLSIAVDIIPDLPDSLGYTRLETVAMASSPTACNFQIRKNGVSGTGSDVVLQASCYVSDFNTDFGQNSAAKVTCTLVAAAAPTTDLLA
jgi:predicted secreted protein